MTDSNLMLAENITPRVGKVLKFDEAPVIPCDNFANTERDGCVKLRISNDCPLSQKTPITVHNLFASKVEEIADHPAMAYKPHKDADWTYYTYQEYYDLSCAAAKSFIKLGLRPHQSVGILGFNSAEWFISNMGSIFAGGLSCGIYATNSAPVCQYIARDADIAVFVVENDAQMSKILSVLPQLPNLKAIVQYRGSITNKQAIQFEWHEFMELGKDIPDQVLIDRLKKQAPNQCASLIYTSGTTGQPKGVMISHDNLVWTGKWLADVLPTHKNCDVSVSYLPLSHIAAQICDIYLWLTIGACLYFAQPDALRGSLGGTLKEVRPTLFLGVPRVWEKIREAMMEKAKDLSMAKRMIAYCAKYVGYYGTIAQAENKPVPWGWWLSNYLILSKVKQALGLDRCACFSAAAPLTKETLEYFAALGIPICEVYGMSESSGPQTISTPDQAFRLGSAGLTHPGGRTKIDFSVQNESSGQVCMWGRNVFMGYLDAPEKTAESFDEEGYLLSGDLGYEDEDGFLFITGRIKELIITSGGENVAPVPIEDRMLAALPCLRNAMVIGDRRKFLSMLITFKSKIDENQNPTDDLDKSVIQWASGLGCPVSKVTEILTLKDDSPIHQAVTNAIKEVNKQTVSRAAQIQKFRILPREFSIAGGELGPTLKLRRPKVVEKYESVIDSMYTD